MVMGRWSILLLWCFWITRIDRVHSQLPEGFISIDCGIAAGDSYTDSITNIPYTSDSDFIDTGDNYSVTSPARQETTLRSFQNEPPRNCYTIQPVQNDLKYLVRATFMYGNYDRKNTANIVFDLHIGVNFWTTVNVTSASFVYSAEALIAPTEALIWVCLVDIGSGTPFISSLEVRPLEKTIYNVVTATNALGLLARVDMGSAGKAVRYPDDIYDRIWDPDSDRISHPNIPDEWQANSTDSIISYNDSDTFRVPSTVMQTAVIRRVKNDDWLNFSWYGGFDRDGADYKYYMNIHFTDIDEGAHQLNLVRKLNVYVNDKLWLHDYRPPYLRPGYQYSTGPLDDAHEYKVSIRGSSNSDLPPIMNALEVYYVIDLPELATDENDVDALMSVKNQYQVKKNWMGDPCAPKKYSWNGVTCNNYGNSGTPRVITLDLSSSGLTGGIPSSLEKLGAITSLDLSNNSLEGEIPDFLAALPSLQLLNLTGNNLNGLIPLDLLSKSQSGSLTLSVEGNPSLCANTSSCGQNHCPKWGSCGRKKTIISFVSIVAVVLVVGPVLYVWRLKRRKSDSGAPPIGSTYTELEEITENFEITESVRSTHAHAHAPPIVRECQVYTYNELEQITKNFEKELGSGGGGTVYYGTLESRTEVAVKKLTDKSEKAIRDFLAEVQTLTRVHHIRVVPLIGYWMDGGNLALVYEYMAGGNLQDHLSGEKANARPLNWVERLRIALGAAQGLEYLHVGCKPKVVHRDVKTSNILLNGNLEAKVADFGLAKEFICSTETHQTLEMIGGTAGYVDPEYNSRRQLSPKSDVYSFGVVLFELITGHPALLEDAGAENLVDWVELKLKSGGVADIVDSRLKEYSIESITKVFELAKRCTEKTRINRPSMSDVVAELKESLKLEERFKLKADREEPEAPLRAGGMT